MAKPFEIESGDIELEAEHGMDVATARLTFAPGSATGWHTHSGPVLATITAGTLTLYDAHCKGHTYGVGETFVEQGGRHLSMARNNGRTTTETITTFLLPEPTDETFTPAPAPGCAR